MASARSTMLDLAEKAQMDAGLSSSARPDGRGGFVETRLKPGEYLARQPEAVREKLKGLRSEDIVNARWPLWDVS